MLRRKFFFGFLSLLLTSVIYASDPAPLAMLKDISSKMMRELDKNIKRVKSDNHFVYALVNKVLVPHFDLTRMAQSVVGRNSWQKAPGDIQKDFIREFTSYVIRTYSSALQSYDGETIKFYPMRRIVNNKARVSSDIIVKNGPPVHLQYGLLQADGKWKIYDFSVDGISIVKNYNAQFASTLRQRGLSGLVKQLQERNLRS